MSEIGIDPNEEGVVENVDKQITPPKGDVSKDWQPGDHLSKDKLFDIQEKTKKRNHQVEFFLQQRIKHCGSRYNRRRDK